MERQEGKEILKELMKSFAPPPSFFLRCKISLQKIRTRKVGWRAGCPERKVCLPWNAIKLHGEGETDPSLAGWRIQILQGLI